ncbi:MAG TPA: hypothetical protein VHS06_03195 [Chloroflexota bacterium]|nr:hypothetical protein [Chloroflexota bacterium]
MACLATLVMGSSAATLAYGAETRESVMPADGIFGSNLIVNGDAEAGRGALFEDESHEVIPPPGWRTTGKLTAVVYVESDAFPTPDSPGPANRGANFLAGGPDCDASSASQTIDVASGAAAIDGGKTTFVLDGYLGGYWDQEDSATLTATFRGADAKPLGSATLGPATVADRKGETGLFHYAKNGAVPVGTRSIEVVLNMVRANPYFNDGYADNLSLVLTQPPAQPTAQPAAQPTAQPQQQSQPQPIAQTQAQPSFKLGFKALADQIPDVVGQPIEDEHWGANGDSLQQTTTGLMVWRKADNWTAFTNGSRSWINGPAGAQERGNDERFPWEQ